jgi:hypothetical protein
MSVIQKTVYVETTIPSFYYTLRDDPESVARMHWTRQWWTEYAGLFSLATSAAVIDELRRGTSDRVEDRIALLGCAMILPVTDDVVEIADVYIKQRVMPRDPEGDALHMAIASYYKIDFLLTWNCKHLANARKFQQLRVINFELGLPMPVIATPLNFGSSEVEKDD